MSVAPSFVLPAPVNPTGPLYIRNGGIAGAEVWADANTGIPNVWFGT